MTRLRSICGLAALITLAVGLNMLVLKENLLGPAVLGLLGTSLLTGVVWVAWSLTAVARHSQREGRMLYGLNTLLTSVAFLGICIVIYAFAQHGHHSWDLSKEGRRTLSEQTVQVLENLSKDVEVVGFFLQVDDELVRIAKEKTERFLEQCQEHTSHLNVEFLDPQVDRARLEGLSITHASTQGTVVIRCGNRQKVIMLSGGSPRMEERDFTNAVINVIRETQPKVCFLTGHGERSLEDKDEQKGGSMLKTVLESESYVAERISIEIGQPEIPPDCAILFINGMGLSGPQSDLHPEEIKAIQAFLDRGGRFVLLIDSRRKIFTAEQQVEQLSPWLEQKFGIIIGNDVALSPANRWNVEFTGKKNAFREFDKEAVNEFTGSFNAGHRITQNFDQKLLFSAACTVRLADKMPEKVVGTQLLRTTPDFYAETDLATLMSQGKASKSPEEKSGPLSMAVAVTAQTDFAVGDSGQTRDARLVVVGDSDFASNGQIAAIPGNLNFILNSMAWLSESEDLIAIRATGKQDPPVMLSDLDRRACVWVAVLGTLQTVVLAGLLVYLTRRRYQ